MDAFREYDNCIVSMASGQCHQLTETVIAGVWGYSLVSSRVFRQRVANPRTFEPDENSRHALKGIVTLRCSFYMHGHQRSTCNFEMQVEDILDNAGRSATIELILATDMKQHFSLVSRLQVISMSQLLSGPVSHCPARMFGL